MAQWGLFLSIFLSVYTIMNLVVYAWLLYLFQLRSANFWIVSSAFWCLAVLFPIAKLVTLSSSTKFTRFMLLCGHNWLGTLFPVFVFSVFCLILLLLFHLLPIAIPQRLFFQSIWSVFLFLMLFFIIVGRHSVKNPILKSIRLEYPKAYDSAQSLRIVQLSDLHINELTSVQWWDRIVDRTNVLKPDIIVFTGDTIDAPSERLRSFEDGFKSLNARLGMFAITGNHEFYIGVNQAVAFLNRFHIEVLRNSAVSLPGYVNLIGIDDPTGYTLFNEIEVDYDKIHSEINSDLPVILLKHQPTATYKDPIDIFLQLSGHTHNGQIWPFSLMTGFIFKPQSGLHQRNDSDYLYISSGTGTWGPPFRILTESEITLFQIEQPER